VGSVIDDLRDYVSDLTAQVESALFNAKLDVETLRRFTLNELYIAPYDYRALSLFVPKASADDEVDFVSGLLEGGPRWTRNLRHLAEELKVTYRPELVSPEAVGYTHFLTWLGINGNLGDLAVFVGVNFRSFCVNTSRLANLAEDLGVRSASFLRCKGVNDERERLIDAIAERYANDLSMYRHVARQAQYYELAFWRHVAGLR
jgi:hypothetical protein